jgi:hypothetical protein
MDALTLKDAQMPYNNQKRNDHLQIRENTYFPIRAIPKCVHSRPLDFYNLKRVDLGERELLHRSNANWQYQSSRSPALPNLNDLQNVITTPRKSRPKKHSPSFPKRLL